MIIHEFGEANPRKLLFFPCTAERWTSFEDSVKLLAKEYHVMLVMPDGHEPQEKKDFTSVEQTVDETVAWLRARSIRSLDALYGLSMGGGMAMHLIACGKFPVKRVLVDAGTAPYTYPRWICKIICVRDFLMMKALVASRRLLEAGFPPERFTPEGYDAKEVYDEIQQYLKTYSNRTIWNIFWSANNYSVPEKAPETETEMLFWVGEDEWGSRFRDLKWAKRYFPRMKVRTIPKMAHAEYCMIHPRAFAEDALAYFLRGDAKTDGKG